MIQTGLLFSLFQDLERAFGDRSPSREKNQQFLLALFGLADQLLKMGRPVPVPVLLALFLAPFLRAVSPDHPFLGERERHIYLAQTIRLALHQVFTPFSVPKGIKEMACQILMAQSFLGRAIQRGAIPKRMRRKKYFQEAILFFGIESQAKGEKIPLFFRRSVPSDFLPWWPKGYEAPRYKRKP
jgi:hypothetical protein